LPLSPFPAQLLAAGAAAVAGAARRALRGAAALHGLPAVPRAALAPRPERAEELLPRLPLLAGCVLSGRRGTNHRVTEDTEKAEEVFCLLCALCDSVVSPSSLAGSRAADGPAHRPSFAPGRVRGRLHFCFHQ